MRVAHAHDFASFRRVARDFIAHAVAPHEVSWNDALLSQPELFGAAPAAELALDGAGTNGFRVPRRFVELSEQAVLVRRADRFALAYRVLYRLSHGEPRLMEDVLDADVRELTLRAKSVRKDEEHMRAFLRFRRSAVDGLETFVAWYAPQHFVLGLTAPFFLRRFASQRFSILTPDASVFWDGTTLHEGPGAPRSQAPADDELEPLFQTYYEATFNPARTNLTLFQRHVPQAFQRGMPELRGLTRLARDARAETPTLARAPSMLPTSWSELTQAALQCRACPLGERATQTVLGTGPTDARLCLVGEQPGDEEDQAGAPFMGPAGQLLDRALAQAQLDRSQLYVTNAVKHFSYRLQGKKRLHVKPTSHEVHACKPWLQAELALLKPEVIVCLGATAAQSFLGRGFSVTRNRGRLFETPWARHFLVSYHPAAVLRAPEPGAANAIYAALVEDLQRARTLVSTRPEML